MLLRRTCRRRRAFALIVSMSMLGLMSVLAVAFVVLSTMERDVSANYVDLIRARQLAFSGIERAVAELRQTSGRKSWDSTSEPWACQDGETTPLSSLATPSYQAPGNAYGRAYSGALSGTHEPLGDTYCLRVLDAARCLYVNGRQPNLARVLDNLGAAIQAEGLGPNPCPPGTGARILAARNLQPGSVFASKDELAPIVGDVAWSILRPYLTEHAWVDLSVLQPKPQQELLGFRPGPIPEDLAFQTAMQATGSGRAPVNVNTASIPVLVAVLAGLQGRFLESSPSGYQRTTTAAVTLAEAQTIARAMVAARRAAPFVSWQQFNAFVDQLRPAVGPSNPNVIAELIKSMANPNALTNKFNPDRLLTHWISKDDLTYFTTEFCFSSMGVFEVEALGRVTWGGGRERATKGLRCITRVFETLRHTSQQDFESNARSAFAGGTVRSFPENLLDYATPSALDGQVCIKETDTVGGAWRANFDATLQGSDNFLRTDYFGYADCREGVSVFAPTNTAASDLFPDGLYQGKMRGKLAHFSSFQNLEARTGTVEFWVKPDRFAEAGGTQAIALLLLPTAAQAGYLFYFDVEPGSGVVLSAGRYVYDAWGSLYPGTRLRPDLATGFYYDLFGAGNPGNRLLSSVWHHVAICWDSYISVRMYIDGRRVIDSSGFFKGGPPSVPMMVRHLPGLNLV